VLRNIGLFAYEDGADRVLRNVGLFAHENGADRVLRNVGLFAHEDEQSVKKRRPIRPCRRNRVLRNVGLFTYEDGTECYETSAYLPMKMEKTVLRNVGI